jgi:hypothetical protein
VEKRMFRQHQGAMAPLTFWVRGLPWMSAGKKCFSSA